MIVYNNSRFDNGLTIITAEDNNSEIVTISIWVKAGSRYETPGGYGYAHILEHILLKGTKKHPSITSFSTPIDDIGATKNAFTNHEWVYFFIQASKEHFEMIFALLAEIFTEPLFDTDVFDNEKKPIIQEFATRIDTLYQNVYDRSFENSFPKHPLSNLIVGNAEMTNAVTLDQVKKYFKQLFTPENMAVVVTGNVSHDVVVKSVTKHLSSHGNHDVEVSPVAYKIPSPRPFFYRKTSSKQSYISINFSGEKLYEAERLSADLLANRLDYGATSVLMQELRNKTGLTYTQATDLYFFSDAYLFRIITSTEKPREVLEILNNTLPAFINNITREDFDIMKDQSIGILARSMNNPYKALKFCGDAWIAGDTITNPAIYMEKVRALTFNEFRDAAKKILNFDRCSAVILGPEEIKESEVSHLFNMAKRQASG
jgi:predicted Zn-dependent peptidase